MKLMTVHRILIGSGVAVFLLYAVHEVRRYINGDAAALGHAVLSVGGACVLLGYLRWLRVRHLA